jgi:hypothetical protein
MQINKRQLKKWIAALDSGEYKQGKGQMQRGENYCCLGVACKIIVPRSKLNVSGDGELIGGFPACQIHSPDWLKKIDDHFWEKTAYQSLHRLNDGLGFTFPEIATLLELVYIHKILD